MPLYVDRVLETTSSTGTGDVTLLGATVGYQTFSAGYSTGTPFDYSRVAVDGSGTPTGQWEVGTGHLSSTGVLVRDFVWASSTGTTGVGGQTNFSAGTSNIFGNFSANCIGQDANTDAFDLQFGTL